MLVEDWLLAKALKVSRAEPAILSLDRWCLGCKIFLHGVWVAHLLINIACKEIKESVISLTGALLSYLVLDGLSLLLLFQFLLVHLEVGVEKTEGSHDEHDEEVNDLESHVSLHVQGVEVHACGTLSSGLLCCGLLRSYDSIFRYYGSLLVKKFWLVSFDLLESS